MKKTVYIIMAVAMLTVLTACKTESYSTSTTDVTLTTTKDGETTQNTVSSEVSLAATTPEGEDVDNQGGKYDGDEYDLNYHVTDDGHLIVYGPESEGNYWRVLTFDEATDTMAYVADEIDDNSTYYVEIAPKVENGTAQTVLGHFTSQSSDEAVDFAIFDVDVIDGKVDSVTNAGFTDDLSVIGK